MKKKRILVVDDTEINRSLLSDILSGEFDIVEASNGIEALDVLNREGDNIALVLLDIVMPVMDGFEVLASLRKSGLIDSLPVIIISSETSSTYVDHSYDLGAAEYISRPFDGRIIRHRVQNTITLYSKQKQLEGMVINQILEKEKSNYLMVDILSNIVEFRNGESGLHVMHIRVITEQLLKRYVELTRQPDLTPSFLALVVNASALHDVGNIAISSEILNKPGKLTPEEFAIMKTHASIGAEMLERSPYAKRELLVRTARDICRWHHERWDGGGYPDGLAGDDIPLSAQVVALADVYDALTSERVYKPAFSHEKAMDMIFDGECGAFNPLLLQCLEDVGEHLRDELKANSLGGITRIEAMGLEAHLLSDSDFKASNRTLALLEQERTKYRFFASMSNEIQFEYSLDADILTFTEWGAAHLEVSDLIVHPYESAELRALMTPEDFEGSKTAFWASTPGNPTVEYVCLLKAADERRWFRTIARTLWSNDEQPQVAGMIGKIIDVNDETLKVDELKRQVSQDLLTKLHNQVSIRDVVDEKIRQKPDGHFALMLLDLDHFKTANDERGHTFGDDVLVFFAKRIIRSIRENDVAARAGGDEFLVFAEYGDVQGMVKRLFNELSNEYDGFMVSASMGVALYPSDGESYRELFVHADEALYASKRQGRGCYRFYNESMRGDASELTPMDNELREGSARVATEHGAEGGNGE